MAATTFTAIDSNGNTHKRTSKSRTYTHTVVARRCKAEAIKNAHAMKKSFRQNAEWYAGIAATPLEKYTANQMAQWKHMTAEYCAEEHGKAAAKVAAFRGGTPDSEAAAQVADMLAKIEATDWSAWHNLGWCGRADLAHKLAAKGVGGHYREAKILEAVQS